MEAIVLAGGLGTRLRAEVPDLPKPMAPVGGQPFLGLLLHRLAQQRVSRVVLSLGYKAQQIIDHFGSSFAGMTLEHVVESRPLGTGGAIRRAMTRVKDDHVHVFNGDTYLDLDLAAVETLWQMHREPVIVARPVADASRYGCLLAADGRLTGFAEKSAAGAGIINAGCYVFNAGQFDAFELDRPFSLERDVLADPDRCPPMRVFVCNGQFIDIGVPEDYRRAQKELASP
ncbi:D-glycero-alpha-D-manno-heptose 1-phosphate guanylyltransferase [Variovorax sp. TBS-050B]|uniref:nucleotidyltransferase family protein n=1 Tax=Variovorax sp. TBS-050B TaxID=2940551 RepID=UPI0024760FF9|nr:nucleotidyltransferase family protein [Variovorax sp. TBS-050B]MDH6592546.1 D-glycero-alpha-D-manno-heptose 1-phosphate guanylyltransferase [Variovorax sp. TBS-050B]